MLVIDEDVGLFVLWEGDVTDLLLGVWGVVRVNDGCRVVEHGALKLLFSICVRVCAYAPRSHMVRAGDDVGRRQMDKR